MRNRLLLGPVMILLLLGGLFADEWLDGRPLPAGIGYSGKTTFPPGIIVFLIVLAISILAARELASILAGKGIEASKRIMTVSAMAGLAVSALVPSSLTVTDAVAAVSTASVLVLAFAMVFYARNRTVEGVVAATGGALLSFVYLGLMFGFILAIRREHSAWILGWVLLVTKACDIGAYFTGRAIGRHKLIPWLSPGKTWEGLAGGLVLATVASVLGTWALLRVGVVVGRPPLVLAALPGLLFGLVGQAGDLVESVFKRDAGTKDSGRAIPGFGGVLDVLDSPLLVAPLAYWWLVLMRQGGYLLPVDPA